MSRVLVVYDEQDYCDELELGLRRRGHEVQAALNGRAAIRLGVRYQPDVLVADWMLKNSLHGLHVCEALRAVAPRMQTILITGFASDDLETRAAEHQVFRFLEKPFTLDEIHTAVREAGGVEAPQRPSFLPAVIELDSAGRITFANPRAGELFSQIRRAAPVSKRCPTPTNFADLFDSSATPELDSGIHRWVEISPRTDPPVTWRLRSRKLPDNGWLLVLLDGDEPRRSQNHPVIQMLLEITKPIRTQWPFDGRVLVIDEQAVLRHDLARELEAVGCICHASDTHEEALRLFRKDPGVKFVILSADIPGGSERLLVRTLKAERPGVAIVGSSQQNRREEFTAIGVERFLHKPWKTEDFINLLTGRIGSCVDCGLPIPLRLPESGEVAGSWVCRRCGSRYSAVLDNDFPPDVVTDVRPPERQA